MAKHVLEADEEVLRVLRASAIDDAGLTLPGQLSRPDYLAVNKFLEVAGAKWNRKAERHLFSSPQAKDKIASLLGDGRIVDEKKLYNFFPTPPDIAKRMADMCGILAGKRVLEPSAGSGNLIRAAMNNATGFDCFHLVAVEKDPLRVNELDVMRQKTLYANGINFDIRHADFLECCILGASGEGLGWFDFILMNPPFENGGANADIKHILHAQKFLKRSGRLVAICAGGPRQAEQLEPLADIWELLQADTFKEAGTGVRTILLSMGAV